MTIDDAVREVSARVRDRLATAVSLWTDAIAHSTTDELRSKARAARTAARNARDLASAQIWSQVAAQHEELARIEQAEESALEEQVVQLGACQVWPGDVLAGLQAIHKRLVDTGPCVLEIGSIDSMQLELAACSRGRVRARIVDASDEHDAALALSAR